MIYQWKAGAHQGKLDAQAVGERLESIRETYGGITAEVVVNDARPARSLLHPAFEWRDAVAAEEYRKVQARDLIRSVVVARGADESASTVRAFVVIGDVGEQEYESINVVMADPDLRSQVLRRALRELRSWQSKYRELEELASVFAEANKLAA